MRNVFSALTCLIKIMFQLCVCGFADQLIKKVTYKIKKKNGCKNTKFGRKIDILQAQIFINF